MQHATTYNSNHIPDTENLIATEFLVFPINLDSGDINFSRLQCGIAAEISDYIHNSICELVGGYGFNWDTINEQPLAISTKVLNSKNDALLALMVYNHRLDINLDVSDNYLLIKKYGRIILTTESLLKENIGYVTHIADADHKFPVAQPELIQRTDLSKYHFEFDIIIEHIAETDLNGHVNYHSVAVFKPDDYPNFTDCTTFHFLREHACRNERKTQYETRLHYDFLHQDWEQFRDVSSDGCLPNGHKLKFLLFLF